MKKSNALYQSILLLLALAAAALYQHFDDGYRPPEPVPASTGAQPQDAGDSAWKAGQWVTVRATVKRILADDNEGSRHQRFIVAIDSGRTLLVAHNIDLAPRVPLARGDTVDIRGRYEPNARGGVIHWTHHDPDRDRAAGWILHQDKRYR